MRVAFKEWAVIVDGLGRGRQILVLRKGGIAEGRGGFRVEHPAFLLIPTSFHQQRESVIPEGQTRFDDYASILLPPDRVRIEFAVEVAGEWKLDSLDEVNRLHGQHLWRDEVLAERFKWGREPGIHALALRVSRLVCPVELPLLPAYSGCKSWVELAEDVDLQGAVPVLDDLRFAAKKAELERALEKGPPAPASPGT